MATVRGRSFRGLAVMLVARCGLVLAPGIEAPATAQDDCPKATVLAPDAAGRHLGQGL